MAGALAVSSLALASGLTLDRRGLMMAEWTRDVDTLVEATCDEGELSALALALGRQRDARGLPRLAVLARSGPDPVRRAAIAGLGMIPGGAAALRELLDAETSRELRVAAWHALGQAADASDVDRAITALAGAEARWGAYTLGRLAQRKAAGVEHAVPSLIAAVDPLRPELSRMVAFALFRIRPVLTRPQATRLAELWPQLMDEPAQAWLVPVILPALDGAERRAWLVDRLDGPGRLVRQATIPAMEARDLSASGWRALLDDEDGWVRLRAAERLGAVDPTDGLVDLRGRATRGDATAAERQRLLDVALRDPSARQRSAAASALVETATVPELVALVAAADPVVRELVAERAAADGALATVLVDPLLDAGGAGSTLLAALQAARALPQPDADTRARVEALALRGAFGVRQSAIRLASTWGASLPQGSLPVPGPSGLTRDPAAIDALHGAEVQTSAGRFVIELRPDIAPLAVAAFSWLAESDYFDGLTWHRVVPGFVAQTGDPRGDGMGGPDWLLPDEPSALPFDAGAVGMARAAYDTGSSQWFVTTSPQPHLDGEYTCFGQVVTGLEVVQRLVPTDIITDVRIIREGP